MLCYAIADDAAARRLQQIQEVAGSKAPTHEVMDKLMAGDFDSEQYDAAMAAAFGNDYYVSRIQVCINMFINLL